MAVPESRIADQGRGSMTADADRETWIEQARAVHIEDELARRGIKLNGKVVRDGDKKRMFSLVTDLDLLRYKIEEVGNVRTC